MIEGGYILIARKLFDSDIMDKPPHYLKLWLWMLNKAFWVDGSKLKRGQLITSIAEMQKVGGYKVGYRFRELSVGEVRSCYEDLTKNNMINTTKSTRGFIITICNYEHYQNPNNYEQHNEHATKRTRTTQVQHTIDEEGYKKEKEDNKTFAEFWKAYPKKKGKEQAEKAWAKFKDPEKILDEILPALDWQSKSSEWTKDAGKYIPYPATYLNGKRWLDEKEVTPKNGGFVF